MNWDLVVWVYSLAAFGLAYVCGHAAISRWARVKIYGGYVLVDPDDVNGESMPAHPVRALLVDLVECPACFGWWIGLATGLVAGHARGWPWYASLLVAFYTSGTNFLLGRLTGLIPNPQEE